MDVILHEHEADRLASLDSYHVMDTEPEPAFDAGTRLAASICATPISAISLIGEDRQWFLSRFGIEVVETPRSESICSDVVASGVPFVAEDLTSVPRYAALASVTDPAGIKAYAGVPLIGRDGLPVGVLCVIDTVVRSFSEHQLSALADLAGQVVTALELRRSDLTSGLNAAAVVSEARQPQTLRAALDNNEFIAYFQPVVDLREGRICGLEALLRWEHPTLGLLTPDAFLPGLEVGTLADWTGSAVLSQVCAMVVELRGRGIELTGGVAVNVSGLQLTVPGLARSILATLTDYDLPGTALRVEVTESAATTDLAIARGELIALREAGVGVVADDFGVGWSNLVRLLELPLSGLKIDRQLITGMVGDRVREQMVSSAIALAHTMGFTVVAEGVETQAAADRLLEMGCDRAQGWLFSAAVPASDLPSLLTRTFPVRRNVGSTSAQAAGAAPDATLVGPPELREIPRLPPSPVGDTTLGGPPTDPEHVQRVLLDSARTLLRVDAAEQAVGALIRAVSDLGGSTVPAFQATAAAIPIDISLGAADPLLPTAPLGSQARVTLEQLIPGLVEDAKVAAEKLGRLGQLSEQAETDPLTGLANRRGLSRVRVRQHIDSIAMLDLDHFKRVNDTYGHPAGDRVLVAFSRALRQHLRSTDLVFRLGGEEFLLIMVGTTPASVLVVLEDLRRRWQTLRPLPVTFSAGVAEVLDADLSASILDADGALYRAKENGRDRFELCVAGPDGPVPITRTAVRPVALVNR